MERKNSDAALNNELSAAHRSMLSSRTEENNLDDERRRLAVKYVTGRKLESQDSVILRRELKRYEALLETVKLLEDLNPARNEDRVKWKSTLEDCERVRALIKPESSRKDSSGAAWDRRNYADRGIDNSSRESSENEAEYSRIGRASIRSRYDRFDDSPSKKSPASKRARMDDVGSGRFERRAGVFESANEPCNSIQNRNKWQRFEENPRKTEPRSRIPRSDNDEPARRQNRWERAQDDEIEGKNSQSSNSGPFRTAKAELHIQQQQQKGKKSLGGKASINSKFVCPLKREREDENKNGENGKVSNEPEDERLKGIDEKIIELIRNEIMDKGASISWDDVAGLEHAKKIIKEIVVLPMLRPDIFTGLRRPPKGILLFGPPGTGKTLIGKCIASQSKSTFFAISASSLTSKWIGEGEKMVRALFAVARVHQPSVIFIDEIDSLLTQRSETEHESSRRIKTEFLVQLDGAATGDEDRILVIGATNRPHELDEAARRRFVKRLYVPLPEFAARRQIVRNLLAAIPHRLTSNDIDRVAELSEHYSGADMTNLCKEASMGPIRCIPFDMLENIRKEDVRCVTAEDFDEALTFVRPSVSQSDLGLYVNWDRTYGSGTASTDKK